MAEKVPLPLYDKTISVKDLDATIALTQKYKLIPLALKGKDVISNLAPSA
jgi:hypothetical protein